MNERHRFGDLVDHEIGGGWGSEEPTDDSPAAAFVIRGTDIPRVLVGDVSSVPLRYHKESALRRRVLQHNDIVFEVSGGSKGQPVGRALLVNQRLLDQLPADAMCASFCKLVRLNTSRCDPRYVFRILQRSYQDGTLDAFQVQSTGITNFRWKPFLERFAVELIERRAQQRISAALDLFDGLIENNGRRIELLEQMAQAIYREWFVRFHYPGHEDATLVDSSLGLIPEGWHVSTIRDVAGINIESRRPAAGETIRYLDISALGDRQLMTPTEVRGEQAPGRARRIVHHGDIVWSMVRPGRRAHALLVAPEGNWIASTGLAVLTAVEISNALLFETVSAPEFSSYLVSQEGGSAYPAVRPENFNVAPILRPTAELDQAFSTTVGPLHRLVWKLREAAERLAAVRDLLLPKLVTGQIDVSELDLDAVVGSVA